MVVMGGSTCTDPALAVTDLMMTFERVLADCPTSVALQLVGFGRRRLDVAKPGRPSNLDPSVSSGVNAMTWSRMTVDVVAYAVASASKLSMCTRTSEMS